MLWYSLEAPWQGTSYEYPQHMFVFSEIRKHLPNILTIEELHIYRPVHTVDGKKFSVWFASNVIPFLILVQLNKLI